MAKHQLTTFAALVVLFFGVITSKIYATPVESGDCLYEVNEEVGTASVTKALGTERDVVVKKAVKLGSTSYPVVAIADEAFATLTTTSVKLPETIEVIGNKAFYRCEFLADINIPEGLKKVGENAFGGAKISPFFPEGCEVPENVFALEKSETEEGNNTTDGTETEEGKNNESEDGKSDDKVGDLGNGNGGADANGGTQTAEPAKNETEKSNNAQDQQVNAEDPLLVSKVKDDRQSPASASPSEAATQQTITTTTATEKAAVVDTFALNGSKYELFSDGTAVLKKVSRNKKNLRVPNSVSYQGKKYRVVGISKNAAKGCEKLVKVTLKGNLREIGNKAFYGCKKLKKVNVKNVTKIGAKAFYGCKKLKGVTSNGNVTTIGKKAFGKCSKKLDVTGLLQ